MSYLVVSELDDYNSHINTIHIFDNELDVIKHKKNIRLKLYNMTLDEANIYISDKKLTGVIWNNKSNDKKVSDIYNILNDNTMKIWYDKEYVYNIYKKSDDSNEYIQLLQ